MLGPDEKAALTVKMETKLVWTLGDLWNSAGFKMILPVSRMYPRAYNAVKGQRRKEKHVSLAQRFAQVFGALYLLVGILGFIPPLLVGPLPTVIGPFNGLLLGLFPVNWLHNLAHIAIGVAGLATFRNPLTARSYALAIGVLYLLLFLLGLILPTFFGLLPLGGADLILHLLTALIAFGAYYASREAPRPA